VAFERQCLVGLEGWRFREFVQPIIPPIYETSRRFYETSNNDSRRRACTRCGADLRCRQDSFGAAFVAQWATKLDLWSQRFSLISAVEPIGRRLVRRSAQRLPRS
jgi:hypothetical protein